MIAEVKTLYKSNARDIPAMLRKLADDIEQLQAVLLEGEDVAPDAAVCVIFDTVTGRFNTYGWGDTNIDTSIAFLRVAEDELVRVRKINGALWPVPTGGVR